MQMAAVHRTEISLTRLMIGLKFRRLRLALRTRSVFAMIYFPTTGFEAIHWQGSGQKSRVRRAAGQQIWQFTNGQGLQEVRM